jgi:hypothetical protein
MVLRKRVILCAEQSKGMKCGRVVDGELVNEASLNSRE